MALRAIPQRVQALLGLAQCTSILAMHVSAVCTPIQLRGAQLDQFKQGIFQGYSGLRIAVSQASPPERLGQDGCNRFFASFLLQPTL